MLTCIDQVWGVNLIEIMSLIQIAIHLSRFDAVDAAADAGELTGAEFHSDTP